MSRTVYGVGWGPLVVAVYTARFLFISLHFNDWG